MKHPDKKDIAIHDLASAASRVLSKYGVQDWTEWRDLKDALLRIHPYLEDGHARETTGRACSNFNRGEK